MKKSNDWVIALAVVISSIFLFVALFMALRGTMAGRASQMIAVDFSDVMGVNPGAQVKWAGARVGTVSEIRLLTSEERIASGDPKNMVRVTLALRDSVPLVPADLTASVAADTLLSDKIILLESGPTPGGPPLAPDAVVRGISPVTIDALVRDLSGTLDGMQALLGGSGKEGEELMNRLHLLLGGAQELIDGAKPLVRDAQGVIDGAKPLVQDAQGVIDGAKPLVGNVGGLTTEARELIASTKEPLARILARLDETAGSLDQLTRQADALIRRNEQPITTSLASLEVAAKNLQVTSTYTKILFHNLARRPTMLLWGGKPPQLPSEAKILRSRGPVGAPDSDVGPQ